MILTTAIMGLSSAAAWAAGHNSLTVSGPRQATVGQQVKLHLRGHAARDVHRLVIWLDNRECADRAKPESGRPELRSPSVLHVHGTFRALLTIQHSKKGTHVVCAYLEQRRTLVTEARASWRYVTS